MSLLNIKYVKLLVYLLLFLLNIIVIYIIRVQSVDITSVNTVELRRSVVIAISVMIGFIFATRNSKLKIKNKGH